MALAPALVSSRNLLSPALLPRAECRFSGNWSARNDRFPKLNRSCVSTTARAHSPSNAGSNSRPLLKIAGVIGGATAISKVLGLLRELVLAAVFGVGPVVDAFGYASIIPGFFLSILGGVNGPIHLTMTAALSKLTHEEGTILVEETSAAALLMALCFSIMLFTTAGPLIDAAAPGLQGIIRNLAIFQLRIMAPTIVSASLIGIGHGRLSALGIYGFSSICPAVSSILVIIGALLSRHFSSPVYGAVLLAAASTLGAFVQWAFQRAQAPWGFRFTMLPGRGVQKVLTLVLPAAVGSGMLQIATYTDLYFASYFPQATASLGYANLLVMAPVGIISSAILVPMLSTFSRLSQPVKWPKLRSCVMQTLFLCLTLTLPMTSVMVPLAKPIVRLVFQRHAFGPSAVEAVSTFVKFYVIGSTFYLARDLLVGVFYALEDGQAPFYVSTTAIVANAILDWLFIHRFGFGPEGLVLATTLVNVFSVMVLGSLLSRKLQCGLKFEWVRTALELLVFAGATGFVTSFSYRWLLSTLYVGRLSWISQFICIATSSMFGLLVFLVLLLTMHGENVHSLLGLGSWNTLNEELD